MERFDDLTPEAAVDLRRELRRPRRAFGGQPALRMQARSLVRFRWIADGTAMGHRHRFAGGAAGKILCLTVARCSSSTTPTPATSSASSTGGGT